MNKKRIAICFYGEVRLVEIINDYFSQWIDKSDEYDFDFFISTWNDFDTTKLTLPFTESEYIDFDKIDQFCVIEGNKGLSNVGPVHHNTKIPKACYLINKVVRLKESYENQHGFSYDLVMIARNDVIIDFDETMKSLDNMIAAKNIKHNNPIVSLSSKCHCYEPLRFHKYSFEDKFEHIDSINSVNVDTDLTFIETSDVANLHANLYNLLWVQRKDLDIDFNYQNNGHTAHGFCFVYYNFMMISNKIGEVVVRPMRDLEILKKYINDGYDILALELYKNRKLFEKRNPTITGGELVTRAV